MLVIMDVLMELCTLFRIFYWSSRWEKELLGEKNLILTWLDSK